VTGRDDGEIGGLAAAARVALYVIRCLAAGAAVMLALAAVMIILR
jgi:hypothetical protein